ncbi:AAA family ATPase [Methylobacterium sp. WL19]|uniref:ParA family protein n=1 Tax=Methylobacterium sp. WL19 TaxID=2603896 RepID=UPI0011CA6469|nr:AAA family ATPase [Methylobacterium sp. WL19]TXN24955.1 AAA family ATPase [Methylobacterium sp. WL19]
MAKRISVINFKGGVGKTTLAFQLAAGLVRFHSPAKVLVVDMDHQSSISILCLGPQEWNAKVKSNKTANEIFKPFIGQSPSMPGSDIVSATQLNPTHYKNLKVVPASLQLDDIEIELTASHHGNAISSEWNKRTLVCRWLEESGIDSEFDYIIFDCPPATKIVSQNAIAASHGYIIPVIPEAVMERGAPHLFQMVRTGIDSRLKALAALGTPRSMHVPDTKLAGVAITRIKTHGPANSGYTDDHTQHLASLQRFWKSYLVQPYIEDGTGISQALAEGVPVYDKGHTQNIGSRGLNGMYQRLTAALKTRIDAL